MAKFRWLTVPIIALICTVLTVIWLAQTKIGLGVSDQWTIVPHGWWAPPAWITPLSAMLVLGGLAAVCAYDRFKRAKSAKEAQQSNTMCLGAITLFALLWPWAILGPGGTTNLVAAHYSDVSNQYYATAWQIDDARQFAREYARKQQDPPAVALAHVATHPPGAVLFYYGSRVIYERIPALKSTFETVARALTGEELPGISLTANGQRQVATRSAGAEETPPELPFAAVGCAIFCAFIISLILALSTRGVYTLASYSSGETTAIHQARGLLAAALFATAPAIGLFTFTLDALIASGTIFALVFLLKGLSRQKYFSSALSGVVLAIISFLSFGALSVVAASVLIIIFYRKNWWQHGAVLLAGFVATWGIILLLFPMPILQIFNQAMAAHRFATVGSRSWEMWVWMNIVMFAVFSGFTLWWLTLKNALVALKNRFAMPEVLPVIIGCTFLLMVFLLTISGSARGEIERLWIFIIPALAVLAAQEIKLPAISDRSIKVLLFLIILQCVQSLLMMATLAPLVRPL